MSSTRLFAAIKYFSLKGKVQISKSKRPVTRKLRQQLIKIWLLFSCLFQKLLQIEYQAYEQPVLACVAGAWRKWEKNRRARTSRALVLSFAHYFQAPASQAKPLYIFFKKVYTTMQKRIIQIVKTEMLRFFFSRKKETFRKLRSNVFIIDYEESLSFLVPRTKRARHKNDHNSKQTDCK